MGTITRFRLLKESEPNRDWDFIENKIMIPSGITSFLKNLTKEDLINKKLPIIESESSTIFFKYVFCYILDKFENSELIKDYIIYITDNPNWKAYKSKTNCVRYFNSDIISFEEVWNEILSDYIKDINVKFDKIIMNPPYDGNLHLKIVDKCLNYINDDGKIVNLSPIRWLRDPLAEYKLKSDWNTFKTIRNKLEDITPISLEDMSRIFGGIDVSGGIYILSKKGNFDISSLRSSFLKRLHSMKYKKIKDFLEKDKLDGWRVRCGNYVIFKSSTRLSSDSVINGRINYVHHALNRIYFNGYTENNVFWSNDRLPGAGNKIKPEGTPIPSSVSFKSKEECINFVNSTRTKMVKYICKLCNEYGGNADFFVPYLEDYTHPWTDEMLYEYFGLTDEEIKLIEETIK